MVVGSFFINHNVVLGENVCSLSDAAPQLFASPLLPCCFAYACMWVIRVFMPCRFFFSPTIETLITAPTLSQASASLSSLYPAPAVLFCQLQVRPALAWYGMWGGGMPGKHKEIRQELREWEEICKSGGKEHPQAARFYMLRGGK